MNKTTPWYRKAHRWCQCNLTEIDGRDCDIHFWQEFWQKNAIEGIIVNAGGTVAYFPSENPYQYRAKYLGERDLLGEFVAAARAQGIAVMARMDVNQAVQALYEAHPDWFALDEQGRPYRSGERYLTCINSDYYRVHIPRVMREIYERYRPDAFGDNSWTGCGRMICHCARCRELFRAYCGLELPEKEDYTDRAYRLWLKWSIGLRTEVWNLFNRVTQEIGGEDCLWMGMLNADFYPDDSIARLYDYAKLTGTGKAQMLDSQSRDGRSGFDQNSVNGLAMHQVFGDDALIIESNACYHFGKYFMRRAANAPEETRTWMRTGISAGIAPSVHFIGSKQDDRRMFDIPTPVLRWQRENEEYLFDRHLVADVAVAWSACNYFFHGQGAAYAVAKLPFMGIVAALKRERIGYFPISCDHIARDAEHVKLLILPDVAAMEDDEAQAVADFIREGGSVVVTGGTGLLNGLGEPRARNLVDEALGVTRQEKDALPVDMEASLSFKNIGSAGLHNYLRITDRTHPVFAGLGDTDIVETHGQCYHLSSDRLEPIAWMIPEFPIYPPEFSYMPDDKRVSDVPAILAGETGYGGRAVVFAVDMDRRFADSGFPDMGRVLGNAIRWALGEEPPLTITGPGELDGKLYRQPGRFIVHVVNHSGLGAWPGSVEECYAVGPIGLRLRVGGAAVKRVCARVTGQELPFDRKDGVLSCTIPTLLQHEMLVIELE